MTTNDKKKINEKGGFEESLYELEKIVKELESGELTLEQGLNRFEVGVNLYKRCKDFLGAAEKKINVLMDGLKEDGMND